MKFLDDERNTFVTAENFESLERQAIEEFAWIVGVEKQRVKLVELGPMTYILKAIKVEEDDQEYNQRMLLYFRY